MRVLCSMLRHGVYLALGIAPVLSQAGPSVHDLKAQYRYSCARCHGLDGDSKSVSGVRLPGRVLTDRKWLAKVKDEDLVRTILNGKGAMPGFRNKLREEEAKRLLTEIVKPLARESRKVPSAW